MWRLPSRRSATRSRPLDIVLVRTGRDAFYGQPDYMFTRLCRHARGDALAVRSGRAGDGYRRLGLGRPARPAGAKALARQEPGIFWAAHQSDLPYSQIERLVNLDALPPFGFKVACFPLKIQGAVRGRHGPSRSSPICRIQILAMPIDKKSTTTETAQHGSKVFRIDSRLAAAHHLRGEGT